MKKGLSKEQAQIIQSILSAYPYPFIAFGSRVKGTYTPYSDLDLCYQTHILDSIIAKIEAQFEQSDLPFKVDLVSWERCSPSFQTIIQQEGVPLDKLLSTSLN